MRVLPTRSLTAASLFLLLSGCSGSSPTAPPQPSAALDPALAYDFAEGAALVAAYDVTLDPATLDAQVTPVPAREAASSPPQAFKFDLDITNFLTPASFRISAVRRVAGDYQLTFTHAHPFPAPDFAAAVSGTNRADLGYSGRLMIMADTSTNAYFANEEDISLDPRLVTDADGYLDTGDLLLLGGFSNDTFPYVLLADEALDNRTGLPNGGPTGNYDAPSGGWQRGNIGPGNNGWTGFDYVHGGQTITNAFTLSGATVGAATVSFRTAILINYVDPRGNPGRANRMPSSPANVAEFAYRLPESAMDGSAIATDGPIVIASNAGATAPVAVLVRDWDAGATEAGDGDLSDESDVALVRPGSSGEPVVDIDAPMLDGAPQPATSNGSGNTGHPGDEIDYTGTLLNTLGTAAAGDYFACVRVTDPEDAVDDSGYHFGVNADTLAPDRIPLVHRTYQVLPIDVQVAGSCSGAGNTTATPDPAPTTGTWVGGFCISTFLWQGRPAVTTLHHDVNGTLTSELRLAIADNPYPADASEWTASVVYSFTATAAVVVMSAESTVINDRIVIAFSAVDDVSTESHCVVAVMNDLSGADPTGPTDWDVHPIAANVLIDGGQHEIDVLEWNGSVFVSAYGIPGGIIPTNTFLTMIGKAVWPPDDTSDWTVHFLEGIVPGADGGHSNDLFVYDNGTGDALYCASMDWCSSEIWLYRANVALPAAPGDWTQYDTGLIGSRFQFQPVTVGGNDRLACSYAHQITGSCALPIMTGQKRVSISGVQNPTTLADWTSGSTVTLANDTVTPGTFFLRQNSVLMVASNGRLIAGFADFKSTTQHGLRVARALNNNPTTPADWTVSMADNQWGLMAAGVMLPNDTPFFAYRIGGDPSNFVVLTGPNQDNTKTLFTCTN